jgi:hypothetical protein
VISTSKNKNIKKLKTKNFDEDFEPGSKLHKLDSC